MDHETVNIHFFYRTKGKLSPYRVEVEETLWTNDKSAFAKHISTALRLMQKEPYEYEARIEFAIGGYWFLRSDDMDARNGTITMQYSKAWNIHDAQERIAVDALKKRLVQFFEDVQKLQAMDAPEG